MGKYTWTTDRVKGELILDSFHFFGDFTATTYGNLITVTFDHECDMIAFDKLTNY